MSETGSINAINFQIRADDQLAADSQVLTDVPNPKGGFYSLADWNTDKGINPGADPKYYIWQGDLQTYPAAMNGDPERVLSVLRDSLPAVNTLRLPFNANCFDETGALHEQYVRFLSAAAAEGFNVIFVLMDGDSQRLGSEAGATAQGTYDALVGNLVDLEASWTSMLDWLDAHPDVQSTVVGYEMINEPAAYARAADMAGGDLAALESLVALYAEHVAALSDLVQARADGNILVGGWNYSADFGTLAETMVGDVSALDFIRSAVGEALVWSAHLYPGWAGTGALDSPEAVAASLDVLYGSILGDNVLVTETNAEGGEVDGYLYDDGRTLPDGTYLPDIDPSYFFARAYEWFAENDVGAAWYLGAQEGASNLGIVLLGGPVRIRHLDSLAHATNLFTLDENPTEYAGDEFQQDYVYARISLPEGVLENGENYVAGVLGYGFGYGGDDTIFGDNLQGNFGAITVASDLMYGGEGNDELHGGAGNDYLFGQYGNDFLEVSSGDNFLFGGYGNDTLVGGTGNDQLEGGSGVDAFIAGTQGSDVIIDFTPSLGETISFSGAYADFYALLDHAAAVDADGDGAVDDVIVTHDGGGSTTIINLEYTDLSPGDFLLESIGIVDGTSGNDTISAGYVDGQGDVIGDGDDLIYLGAGDDVFIGSKGNDVIYGGAGNDTINAWKGLNTIYGGAGNDVIYTGEQSTEVNGGVGDDTIYVDARKNSSHDITGGEGFDHFVIGDQLDGRTSTTVIHDFDLIEDSLEIAGIAIDFSAPNANFTFTEESGDLRIAFGDADSILLEDILLSVANGWVDGTQAGDNINWSYVDTGGESIVETSSGMEVFGWGGNDTILASAGDDTIHGGAGDDSITGYKGNNELYGDAGNDTISSGQHSSQLYGGEGDDRLEANMGKSVSHELTGGTGADHFVFSAASLSKTATALVADFEIGVDTFEIGGNVVTFGTPDFAYEIESDAGDLILHFGDNDIIRFTDLGYLAA